MSKTNKKYSDLYTQTCPYRLAKLGTSLRIRGKLTLKKKVIKFLYRKNKNTEMTHTKSCLCSGVYISFLQRRCNKKSPFAEAFYYFFYKNIYFPMNRRVSMYMRRLTFLVCPVSALINV